MANDVDGFNAISMLNCNLLKHFARQEAVQSSLALLMKLGEYGQAFSFASSLGERYV